MNDLLGGQIQLMFENPPTTLPHVRAGKLKALAVTGKTRSAALPEVPTVAESGLPGFEATSWTTVAVVRQGARCDRRSAERGHSQDHHQPRVRGGAGGPGHDAGGQQPGGGNQVHRGGEAALGCRHPEGGPGGGLTMQHPGILKSPCPVRRVGDGRQHHFFGYYNKTNWDRSGRYLLAQQVPWHDARLTPERVAGIGYFDLADGDRFLRVAETRRLELADGQPAAVAGRAPMA